MPSESIAELPEKKAATNLVAAMARLPAIAAKIAVLDSVLMLFYLALVYGTQRCSRVGTRSRLVQRCVAGSSDSRAATVPRSQVRRTALLRLPSPPRMSPALHVPHEDIAAIWRRSLSTSKLGAANASTVFASQPPTNFA